MDRYLYRPYDARTPREEKVYENIIGRRFERTSIVSRKVEGEFIVPICKVVQNATPTYFEETSYYNLQR